MADLKAWSHGVRKANLFQPKFLLVIVNLITEKYLIRLENQYIVYLGNI